MRYFEVFVKYTLLLTQLLSFVWADCDLCQADNAIACHSENIYSICVNGIPTHDYIECPANHICSSGPFVCYARDTAEVSCPETDLPPPLDSNLCGVCNQPEQIFSCINETTIAFCFGFDEPNLNSLAHCPVNTYCDVNNLRDFCTDGEVTEPSCRTPSPQTTTTTTTTTEPTTTITTTTTEPTTTTTTTTEPTTTTTTTTEPTTTTTTTTEPTTTTTTTTEPTTTTTTSTEPTTTTTTTTPEPTTAAPRTPMEICTADPLTLMAPLDNDTKCVQFVSCDRSDPDTVYAVILNCPANQYFSQELLGCSTTKTPECL